MSSETGPEKEDLKLRVHGDEVLKALFYFGSNLQCHVQQ